MLLVVLTYNLEIDDESKQLLVIRDFCTDKKEPVQAG